MLAAGTALRFPWARTPPLFAKLNGKPFDCAQRGRADVMFHSLDVMVDNASIHAKKLQKFGEQVMAARDIARKRLASGSQHQSAIFLVLQKAFRIQPLHHVGYACLRDLQTRSDVDDARVALRINQLEDALEIIFDGRGIPRGIGFGGHNRI